MPDETDKPIGLPAGLLEAVADRLKENKPVRRTLPLGGRLHIDRQLPFLCVYRRPMKDADSGTARLVLGEASYLRVSSSPRFEKSVLRLVSTIVSTLAPEFGAFLLVEIWAGPAGTPKVVSTPSSKTPRFRLHTRRKEDPPAVLASLRTHLHELEIEGKKARVTVARASRVSPPGLQPLIKRVESARFNCPLLGLEVNPIYGGGTGQKEYPLIRRKIRHGLSLTLKQAFFDFANTETTHQPAHYHCLGRRAVTRAALEVDQRLAAVVNAFDFNLAITPTNVDLAWKRFKTSGYEQSPEFSYRPLAIRPANIKRALFEVPIHRIEDPTLANLFEEKQVELDRKLSMLHDRDTPDFLYGSMQVYGRTEDTLLELANEILRTLSATKSRRKRRKTLDASGLKRRACDEIAAYQSLYADYEAKVRIRKDVSGMLVSRRRLLIGKEIQVPLNRVEGLIQHEIGTHLISHFNGCDQPFELMNCGLPGYEETQEGLAVLAEYFVGELDRGRLRVLAGRARAVRLRTEGAEFIEIFRDLYGDWGISPRMAFLITVRVCRSGGFTKDRLYLAGLVKLMNHMQSGGDLEILYSGKISTQHISIVEELQWRNVLKESKIRPRFLDRPEVKKRIQRIREGCRVVELLSEADE